MTKKIKERIGFHCLLTGLLYFDSFGIEYIPHSILRIQSDGSIMDGFYSIAFIKFMIPGKTLLCYIN